MKKKDSRVENLRKVGEALTALQESRCTLEQLSKQYDTWIDEAGELAENDLRDSFIQDKFEIIQLARDLQILEIEVTQITLTAESLSAIKELATAFGNCCSLIKNIPNFEKLGLQISKQKAELERARQKLREARTNIIGDTKKKVHDNPFFKEETKGLASEEFKKFMDSEKRASATRIEEKVRKTVPMPAAGEKTVGGTVSAAASAGANANGPDIDSLIAMLNSENKKD